MVLALTSVVSTGQHLPAWEVTLVQPAIFNAKLVLCETSTLLSLSFLRSNERRQGAADAVTLVTPARPQGRACAVAKYLASFPVNILRLTALDLFRGRAAPATALHELSAWWARTDVALTPHWWEQPGKNLIQRCWHTGTGVAQDVRGLRKYAISLPSALDLGVVINCSLLVYWSYCMTVGRVNLPQVQVCMLEGSSGHIGSAKDGGWHPFSQVCTPHAKGLDKGNVNITFMNNCNIGVGTQRASMPWVKLTYHTHDYTHIDLPSQSLLG